MVCNQRRSGKPTWAGISPACGQALRSCSPLQPNAYSDSVRGAMCYGRVAPWDSTASSSNGWKAERSKVKANGIRQGAGNRSGFPWRPDKRYERPAPDLKSVWPLRPQSRLSATRQCGGLDPRPSAGRDGWCVGGRWGETLYAGRLRGRLARRFRGARLDSHVGVWSGVLAAERP